MKKAVSSIVSMALCVHKARHERHYWKLDLQKKKNFSSTHISISTPVGEIFQFHFTRRQWGSFQFFSFSFFFREELSVEIHTKFDKFCVFKVSFFLSPVRNSRSLKLFAFLVSFYANIMFGEWWWELAGMVRVRSDGKSRGVMGRKRKLTRADETMRGEFLSMFIQPRVSLQRFVRKKFSFPPPNIAT